MQISERNFKRIMKIENLETRKAKLQEFCLSFGWHGGIWENAMQELKTLNEKGIKTALEKKLLNI